MATRSEHQTVPLSVLLKRELANERIECPELVHGQAYQSKKGEDFTLIKTERQRVLGDGVSTYSVFGLFDGHNGSAAAIYSKENLLSNVLSAIPSDLNRDEWVAALPRALVAGFVKTDKDFQEKAQTSGTTVTFVIIEGWVVTVASVGDSRCILEPAEGGVYYLSADHRLECNEEERDRITASGGEVGRLNTGGGAEIGPLRCWPGGLCLSRSIGDMDVGEFIVPVPYVKQVKRSSSWLKMMSVSLASGLFLVVISALGQLGLPHLSKGGRYPVEHRPLPSSEVDCALIQSPDARELEDFCVSIVKKIKDAFGWAGDIRTETRIGAWTGELPSYLRMVGEADSNIEGISTAPSEKIDTDMRISAHDIASYQVGRRFI